MAQMALGFPRQVAEARDWREESDETLLDEVRAGHVAVFAVLYDRYRDQAVRSARRNGAGEHAEDVVQDAFIGVLRAIRSGGGPTQAFAPYLFGALRNVAIDRSRRVGEIPVDDLDDVAGVVEPMVVADASDDVLDRGIVTDAFKSLPARWQQVLWLTEVEGYGPAALSEEMGIKPTAVAVLASRARSGFRSAWLQAHVGAGRRTDLPEECARVVPKLGDYETGRLTARRKLAVQNHLQGCVDCSAVALELTAVSEKFGAVLVPVVVTLPLFFLTSTALKAGVLIGGVAGAGAATKAAGAAGATLGKVGVAARTAGRLVKANPIAAGATVAMAGLAVVAAVAWASEPPPPDAGADPGTSVATGPDSNGPTPTADPTAPATNPPPSGSPTPTPAAPTTPPPDPAGLVLTTPVAAPNPTTPPAPDPTDGAPGPSPTDEPPAPEPTGGPVDPEPTGGPVDPEPTDEPVDPEPTDEPVDPEPPATLTLRGTRTGDVFVSPTLSGAGEPGATVTILDDAGATVATTVVEDRGAWSATPDPATVEGPTTYRARQTLSDGGVMPAAQTVGPYVYLAPTLIVEDEIEWGSGGDCGPVDGAYVPGIDFFLDGTPGAQVRFVLDGEVRPTIHTLVGSGLGVCWPSEGAPELDDGEHTVGVRYVVEGTDAIGRLAQVSFIVTGAPS
ncbi:sigma-70 family RNA polymerase sigma factor [Occultella glacieicola]|uniref:Sigma-70 family RNA polymerase sigma factor n=1 Tax=Occultella glacieicola TaxID=2518684 RepID=A0ABY2DYB0_9MICO|nr:sigma-70 family RNA polymerase sigma factor [Occultella glacieicola]TDE88585.1 sigma-70 family RNA polymerase sigma factor [Occultella glacieicola]